jgi:transposase
MRRTREILRQKWALGRSHREVARSLGVSIGAVSTALGRARAAGLSSWEAVLALGEVELEHQLYTHAHGGSSARPLPDWAYVHTELGKKGVTLQLLHLEYLERHPDGYAYTQFCGYYRRWRGKQKRSMRQRHRAGEKLFIDYSGKKPEVVDPKTGELREVELFVAVFGASNFTYAEASESQQSADFIASHVRAFEYFGGVAELLVPDQLKSGVTKACRYEPGLQRSYEEMAEHYGTAVMPARPRKPKDKAKVEVAVQVAQRWILAVLRHETFFSLAALNARIRVLLDRLNDRPMRAYRASRRELFERLDRPALRPLHGHDPRDLLPRAAGGFPSSPARAWPSHDRARSHAEGPPEAHGLDAVAAHPLGRECGGSDGGARYRDPGRPSPSRAGVSLLSRHPSPRQALRR